MGAPDQTEEGLKLPLQLLRSGCQFRSPRGGEMIRLSPTAFPVPFAPQATLVLKPVQDRVQGAVLEGEGAAGTFLDG